MDTAVFQPARPAWPSAVTRSRNNSELSALSCSASYFPAEIDVDERGATINSLEHDIGLHNSLQYPATTIRKSPAVRHSQWNGISDNSCEVLGSDRNEPRGVSLPKSVLVSGESIRGGRLRQRIGRSLSLPAVGRDGMPVNNASSESIRDVDVLSSSPPGLIDSKSSKSSSSLNSDDDEHSDAGTVDKVIHCEDAALGDESRISTEDCNLPPDSRPTLKRPPPRSKTMTADLAYMRTGGRISPLVRSLPNGMRIDYPGLPVGGVDGVLHDQSLNLPYGRNMQRTASTPNSPPTRGHHQWLHSRSPSPNKPYSQKRLSVSAHTLAAGSPNLLPDASKENTLVQRRPSWQPGTSRKTAEELEAECNDDDEDVPEEAVLENVPISPMPGQLTSFRSPSTTSLRSSTPSPHRKPSYANLHSAKIPKHAKRPLAPPHPHGQYGSPRSQNHGRPSLSHSVTIAAFPADSLNRKHRSKSWTEDLNEEAKQLSHALEEYAERIDTEKRSSLTSTANTPSSSPPRPTISKTRAKSAAFEMRPLPCVPPMQKGNIMIDPLPISKEKEAVLTRTRPSWLPPKDQKEEKKHLKEFQQMMARAADAEKKRALKEQEARENRDEMQGSIARIWDQHVLPNWDAVVKEPRTRELWWRGVTPRSRGEVWQKAVGNGLELSSASFEAALTRANALEEKYHDMPLEERKDCKEAAWLDAIARDVPDTLPELGMYAPDSGGLHKSLTNVLKAYTMYRSDIGYVYGTHLIAGVVCLILPAPEAFILLANMMNRPLPLAFLVHDRVAMQKAYEVILSTLKYKFTRLHDHLTNPALGIAAEEFLDPMMRCLFTYNLSPEHVSRIWDVAAFEGDRALIRAAVAVLGRLESKLYGSRDEILDLIGWRNEKSWDVGTPEDLITMMREAGKVDACGKSDAPETITTIDVKSPGTGRLRGPSVSTREVE